MKRFSFLVILGALVVILILYASGVFSRQGEMPTVTLPVSDLFEVRKDVIRAEMNAHLEGRSAYYEEYTRNISHVLEGRSAEPFVLVEAEPGTMEWVWVDILKEERYAQSDELAEQEYSDRVDIRYRFVTFLIFLHSDDLPRLAQENLRFAFRDSTGSRADVRIVNYQLDETNQPTAVAKVGIAAPLPDNPRDITWFSLHVSNTQFSGTVDMRWEFQEN